MSRDNYSRHYSASPSVFGLYILTRDFYWGETLILSVFIGFATNFANAHARINKLIGW